MKPLPVITLGSKCCLITAIFLISCGCPSDAQQLRRIPEKKLRDKIAGYWIGQLAGNYTGFPFENLYVDEPIPV